ncbi:MAG: hypothetical protein ABNH00_03460 [Dokdonia sp.]|jgi:hypothetical protein
MKTYTNSNLFALVLLSLLFVACTTDEAEDDLQDDNQQAEQIESVAQNGSWRITNFNDSGQDETSDFAGYSFAFNSDGSLVATNGSNTQTGTWSVSDSSSGSSDDDDYSDDDVDFNIFFPVPDSSDFEDLNDDWDVVSSSTSKIELIDISGGNGETDRLTFEAN